MEKSRQEVLQLQARIQEMSAKGGSSRGGKKKPTLENKMLMTKLDELRVKMARKDNEVRQLKTALAKEIGEGFDIDDILGKPGKRRVSKTGTDIADRQKAPGWRGRSQQIIMLKSKVKRLEQQLRSTSNKTSNNSETATNNYQKGPPRDVDEKVSREISEISATRNQAMQEMGQKLQTLTADYEELEKRFKGSKARIRTLEGTNRKMRGQMKTLLDKTATDDAYISSLREKVQRSRETITQLSKRVVLDDGNNSTSNAENMRLKIDIEEYRSKIERQDAMTRNLKAKIQGLHTEGESNLQKQRELALSLHTQEMDFQLLTKKQEETSRLANLYKGKYETCSAEVNEFRHKSRELEQHCIKLERRLQNISHGGLKRAPPADKFQFLKDALALLTEENEALKQSFRAGLQAKDEEIQILRRSMHDQQVTYKKAVDDLAKQVKRTSGHAYANMIHHEASQQKDEIALLHREIEILRESAESRSRG
eukprot:g4154.t1